METIAGIVLAALAGAVVAAAVLRSRGGPGSADDLTSRQLADMRAQVARLADRVSSDSEALGRRLEGIDSRMMSSQTSNADLARGIFDTLGEVRQATTAVADQARQFSSLQDLLKTPKARGGLGEALLEELLRQVLPPSSYAVQHRFASGAVVDAIVHVGGRVVCIDSKFPLANYRRMCDAVDDLERAAAERAFAGDVDKHIRDISSRYIAPDEGTFDFAVMYVPAEGIYGEILRMSHRRRPLFEMAIEAHVVPMSPLTMYGYLQTVLYGLKCLSIEKSAQAILGYCGRLQQDIERFAGEYDTLGRHITNARNKYEEGSRSLDRFRDRLAQTIEIGDDEAPPPSLEVVGE